MIDASPRLRLGGWIIAFLLLLASTVTSSATPVRPGSEREWLSSDFAYDAASSPTTPFATTAASARRTALMGPARST